MILHISSNSKALSIPDSFDGVCVLSDVHLGAFTSEENHVLEQSVESLFKHARDQNWFVIINGDLFDYWMEYSGRTYPREFDTILNSLQALADQQNTVPFICGNHDNWTGPLLSNLGLRVEKEYLRVAFKKHTFLVTHGDGLNDPTMNLKRKWMNRILRNHTFVSFYQRIFSAQQGISLMRWFSSVCRGKSHHDDEIEQQRLNNWGKRVLETHEVSSVVTGHDHVPRLIPYSCGIFLNTGDFFRRWTFGVLLDDVIQLRTWNQSQQTTELLRSERIPLLHE